MIQNPATVCDCDIILWFIKKSFWEGQVPPSSSKLVGCANPWRIGFPNVSFLVLTLGILAEIWYASLSLDRVSDLSFVHSKRSVDSTIYSHSKSGLHLIRGILIILWFWASEILHHQTDGSKPTNHGMFAIYQLMQFHPHFWRISPKQRMRSITFVWLVATSQRAHQTWRYM